MKKVFLFGGIALAGFGLYRYFKYQIELALSYQYALKDFKILPQTKEGIINVSAVFSITNKSSFKVLVKDYDLQLFYRDISFANTKSNQPITVQPNSTFEVTGFGELDVQKSKIALIPFVKDVANRKPIDIEVSGKINIVFLGIPTSLSFDRQKFNYSVDLIKDYNLGTAYEKLKAKYPKIFDLLGIK
jgi:LEA14-like dessication related protein